VLRTRARGKLLVTGERTRERERNTRARARRVHMYVCITSDSGEQFLSGSRVETELELTTLHDIAHGYKPTARFRVQETEVRRSSTPDGRRAHFGNILLRDRFTSTSR